MPFKFMGWLTLLFGILWSVRPSALRGALTRKIGLRLTVIVLALFLLPLVRAGSHWGWAGMIGILAILYLLLAKFWSSLQKTFAHVPDAHYRAVGLLHLVWGLCVLRWK